MTASMHSRPRWRAPAALALIVPLLLALGATAFAQSCPRDDRPVQVHLETRFDTARVDHTKSRNTINQMHLKSLAGQATIPSHGTAVGLTVTRSEFHYSTEVQFQRRRDGLYCVYLRSVDMQLNQVGTIVYISREFRKNSCNYNVTYEHEKKHVGIYYFTQKEYAPRFRETLARLVHGVNPQVVRTPAEARAIHATAIEVGLTPLLEEMEAERERRNGLLDTPQNYAAERAKCPTW